MPTLLETRDSELAQRGFSDVMNTAQVCKALGLDRKTVRALVREGLLEALRLRRVMRYLRRDVAGFMVASRAAYTQNRE